MVDDPHAHPPDPEDLEALARWEPPATPGSVVALLPNKWLRRLVLGAIPVLAIIFGSSLIVVSQLRLSHSLQAFGSSAGGKATTAKQLKAGRVEAELVAGRPNALRVGVWNLRKKRHERHFQTTLTLRGKGLKPVVLFDSHAGPGHALEANFALPKLSPGAYTLDIQARRADQQLRTRLPVRVVPPSLHRPPVPIEPPKKKKAPVVLLPPDPEGRLVAVLPPAGPKIAAELAQRMTVRTTDRHGKPIATQVTVWLKQGRLIEARAGQKVVKTFTTDSLGLHTFTLHSRRDALSLRVRYRSAGEKSGPPRERIITYDHRTAQTELTPHQLILRPGAEFSVDIRALSSSGFVYLETFTGSRRGAVMSKALSKGRARVLLRAPLEPGLFRIQATDDFSLPGQSLSVQTLFVDPAGENAPGVLTRLAKAVLAALPKDATRTHAHITALLDDNLLAIPPATCRKTGQCKRAMRYLLSRLNHLHYPTAWIADTRAADTKTLKTKQRRLQHLLLGGLAFTALLLLMLVVPLIYTNVLLRRRGDVERAALMAEFEGEVATDVPAAGTEAYTAQKPAQDERLKRLGHAVQVAMVVGVILLAVAMIILLLINLSWGFDG